MAKNADTPIMSFSEMSDLQINEEAKNLYLSAFIGFFSQWFAFPWQFGLFLMVSGIAYVILYFLIFRKRIKNIQARFNDPLPPEE